MLRPTRHITSSLLLVLVLALLSASSAELAQGQRRQTSKQKSKPPITRKKNTKSAPKTQRSTGRSSDRRSSEAELARIRKEIQQFEAKLQQHERNEKLKLNNIALYNKQSESIRAELRALSGKAASIRAELSEVTDSLRETTSAIADLKSSYANGVRYLYTQKGLVKPDPEHYLFSPKNSTGALRNRYYAKIVGERHAKNYARLSEARVELSEARADLSEDLDQQRSMLSTTAREQTQIEQRKQQEAKQLAQLQQDRERIKKELDKRRASAKRLEGIIANLIAKEEARRKAELEKKKLAAAKKKKAIESTGRKLTKKEEKELTVVDDFDPKNSAFKPNSLLWPTNSRKIKQGYGEQRNAELNTVTVNLGIDIAATPGSPVFAVADGEVSLISSLPNYGSIIILRHASGFHTVYADLSGISVGRGAKVKAGQRIASTGENAELGGLLHFEVWRGRNKQNPLAWLR
ncbi:MAG TPA: peptidoglycan DD-metalloendopeptidase family protein [Candidatus Kapabacteria bacterium]|nr:peptidoglycan DD-metalloendopeptidase family protein [Candidatus Kapabacteria bacterium]